MVPELKRATENQSFWLIGCLSKFYFNNNAKGKVMWLFWRESIKSINPKNLNFNCNFGWKFCTKDMAGVSHTAWFGLMDSYNQTKYIFSLIKMSHYRKPCLTKPNQTSSTCFSFLICFAAFSKTNHTFLYWQFKWTNSYQTIPNPREERELDLESIGSSLGFEGELILAGLRFERYWH